MLNPLGCFQMHDDNKRKGQGNAPGGRPAQQNQPARPANQQQFEQEGDGKKGFFGRFSSRFDDALQSGRGAERPRESAPEPVGKPSAATDDLAIRRTRPAGVQRMIIPEGAIIEGNVSGGADTEISGRVEGDITIEGRLFLGPSALITGNVRAGSCSIEGQVEGKVECADDLELGRSGRLNADVLAGKRINLGGQVYGNVTTPGVLRLAAASKITGDVRARNFIMEEGATLNGKCLMRPPAQQQKQNEQQKPAEAKSGAAENVREK